MPRPCIFQILIRDLKKEQKMKRNKFWQHSKLFGVVKTGKVQGCGEGYSETE